MSDLQLFLQHLKQPEYLHILLNPLPVYGMAAGVFLLFVSLVTRRSKEQLGALLWLALMGLATWAAIHYGQRGYDRVLSMSNDAAQAWLKVHMHRAETFAWVFYLTGLSALAAIGTGKKWPKASQGLVWATLLLAFISMNLGGWISQAGGQVRHSEFREGPPRPEQLPPEAEHHHDHGHEHSEETP